VQRALPDRTHVGRDRALSAAVSGSLGPRPARWLSAPTKLWSRGWGRPGWAATTARSRSASSTPLLFERWRRAWQFSPMARGPRVRFLSRRVPRVGPREVPFLAGPLVENQCSVCRDRLSWSAHHLSTSSQRHPIVRGPHVRILSCVRSKRTDPRGTDAIVVALALDPRVMGSGVSTSRATPSRAPPSSPSAGFAAGVLFEPVPGRRAACHAAQELTGSTGERSSGTPSTAPQSAALLIGLARKSSMPAARQRSRSAGRARAVSAITGRCPPRSFS
jgi:hypothetical protein